MPPILIPIYQRAAAAYGLGPQGPAILAGINEIETAFGTNLNVSSAGAVGWMQFMPATWAGYGVDANGDGVADPFNPEDAIFAAASYLSASGMPADTYGAIFAYNHADWYVSEVLANASCHAAEVGVPSLGAGLGPQLQVLKCSPTPAWRQKIPHEYMRAFEDAAARYELGKRGVWALAAVAHLESDFGRGMGKKQLREMGPLGLEPSEWAAYAVDGDGDGRIRHADPVDSAATLARLIWSRGSLSAGIFTHNQAEWYVQAVLGRGRRDRRQLQGPLRRLGAGAAGHRPRNRRPQRRPRRHPRQRPGRSARRRSRRRSRRPTRSPPPPTSGAAATAPSTPTATTAPAPSASPSSAAACSTPPSPPARWRATAKPAPANGSRSTPTPPTPT